MSDLTTREDDWSFQIMAEGSARFFIRVTTPKNSKTSMVFSDFILNPDDDRRAIEALRLIKGQFYGIAPDMKLVFHNIHTSYSDESKRIELIRRHDQIVAVIKEYAAQEGLAVGDALLEPKAGKFETVILIE